MNDLNEQPSLLNNALKNGLILGVVSVVINVILYVAYPAGLVSPWMFLLLIVYLVIVVIFGINYRKSVGGYLSFGKAWQHGFLILLVSGIVGTIFNIILHTVIDPGLKDYLTEVSVENAANMARSFGAPEAAIEQAMDDTRQRTADQFTLGGMLMGFGIGIIFYAIIALITGLIVKKKEPEEQF